MKLYIITREENQYDQFGEYFVAAFTTEPTDKQREDLGINHYGRKNDENTWYNLHVVEEGQLFPIDI